MLKKRLAMLLALSTLMASLGTISTSAEETVGSSDSSTNTTSIVELLNLKRYLLNGNDEYVAKYDYNHDDVIDGRDILLLKKTILGLEVAELPTMTTIKSIDGLSSAMQKNVLDFSLDVFKQQLVQDENTIVSPESLYLALGMTVNGAKGDTQKELKNALFKDVSVSEFNNSVAYLVNGNDDEVCRIANSIWVRQADGLTLNSDFQEYSERYFNAEVRTQPFDNVLVTDVNDWVDEHTDGMIKKVLDEVPSDDTLMYLINAICFESDWAIAYDEWNVSEGSTFTNSKGEEQTVTMLCSNESVYISDDEATGFLKYYEGGRYAFMGILPNEGISVEDYVNGLTSDKFSYLYNNQKTSNMFLTVTMPEFEVESAYNLVPTLQNMGVKTAFTSSADFSNMLNLDNYINDVFQKAYIQVDRYGSRAGAVTVASATATSWVEPDEIEYLNVDLNRPFAYAIVDTETRLPIFMGVVNDVVSPDIDVDAEE